MTASGSIRVGRLGLCVAAVLWAVAPLPADDVDPLDRALLESLEGAPRADSPERIVPRLIESTRTASERLQQGRLDEETVAVQTQILADIDALLKQATPPNQQPQNSAAPDSPSQPPPSGGQSQSNQAQQDASEGAGSGQQQGANDPDAASKESAERNTRGQERAEEERERRLGLSTSAWGHLPPKVREQLRSAFSEEYLPEYDALVRRYYEALARRRTGDPARRGVN